jgi:AAA domain
VQGPPGTGKTHAGARMIVAALQEGRRVAVTANSHAAIQNLLRAVETHATEIGFTFTGVYKGDGYQSPSDLIVQVNENKKTYGGEFDLVAGTAWLLSCEDHAEIFDLLFIDEAGQFSLAATVAAGRCAKSLVLLGDPQQLPQVNQATHPDGSGASVLQHVIGDADVVDPGRGVLLDVSWRMHPEICAFVSERSYQGKLGSHDDCARRKIDAPGQLTGAGLRAVEVIHEGRSQESPEEAEAIAALCRDLLNGGTVTEADGSIRPLTPADVLVVAPYNLAVARIRRHVPDGVRVGTVDRFQGQEAPVVFFTMTCSTADDVPRGLDFLFDRNRLNVAISRAQCLAVLIHSPRLLDANCTTTDQMSLVEGPCRLVNLAQCAAM